MVRVVIPMLMHVDSLARYVGAIVYLKPRKARD
jgi:hypothetical protein